MLSVVLQSNGDDVFRVAPDRFFIVSSLTCSSFYFFVRFRIWSSCRSGPKRWCRFRDGPTVIHHTVVTRAILVRSDGKLGVNSCLGARVGPVLSGPLLNLPPRVVFLWLLYWFRR